MPTTKLTQIAADNLSWAGALKKWGRPKGDRIEVFDSQLPGFALTLYATGRKTWVVRYRPKGGKLVKETIGTFATFPNVGQARERARQSLQRAASGINPVAERRQKQVAAAAVATVPTVRQAIDRYLREYAIHRMRPDYYKETKRALEVDVAGPIGDEPIDTVTRSTIRNSVLAPIVARGRGPHASHVLSYVRPMLQWAVDQEIISGNPAEGIKDPDPRRKQDRERDRHLDDDEIKLCWSAAQKLGYPFGPLFQLLLLFGCRRDELAHATWDEFDFDKHQWTLPGKRSKNGNDHVTHLSRRAVEILTSLPTYGKPGYLFTTTGNTPVSGFGRARASLIAAMEKRTGRRVEHFTIHDLRRSTATGMAEIGVPESIVDRCLNHSGRKVSGVARVYNRSEYLRERAHALDVWARHIEGLINPAPPNVVELAAAVG